MASIRSIAKRSGVSIATVSRVLNGSPRVSETVRQRVMKATTQARYIPSVGKRSSNIAVLYTGRPSLGSPFDSAILQGMSDGLEQHGYDLLILSARGKSSTEDWSQFFLRKGIVGALVRTDEQTRGLCREIARGGVPTLVVADEFEDEAVTSLAIDARKAVHQAIEHLVHLGHERIAITLNDVDDHDHRQRLEAYVDSLRKGGLRPEERMILRAPAYRDAGAACLRQIMGMPNRPTAVFVTDPMAALGLFYEAQRSGVSIPRDLSVIGFDDAQQRFAVFPRMSAVCQDAEKLGGEAMALLIRTIDHGGEELPLPKLECWLELNDSTAAPAAGD